jgi:HSP20 family protein
LRDLEMVKKKINRKKDAVKLTPNKRKEKVYTTPDIWNPFGLFDEATKFFSNDPWFSPWWGHWGWKIPRQDIFSETTNKLIPIDIVDKGKDYKIIAEVPGVSKNDLEIHVTPDNIRICGNVESEITKEDEGYIRKERTYSTLCRTMSFPDQVDPDKSEATLNDGILEIKISKKDYKNNVKKIKIK